jgi:hypothetical protein
MATNLEFINKTTATSITQLDVTGVFTAKYDVYQVHVQIHHAGGAGYFEIRLLQADDSLANESKYDIAALDLKSNTSSSEYKFVDQNGGVGWRGIGAYLDDGEGYGITVTIFNPFADDKYTFGQAQSGSMNASNLQGTKAIGVYKSTQSIGGMRVTTSGGGSHDYINVTTYGVKG